MINICIYEDNYYKQLLPLTYNRPVYDLLIGTNSILDKVNQFFNYANISLHCRNELKPTLKEKLPKNAINSINNGTPCLFINGRTIMTQSLYNILAQLNPAHNHLLLYKGHVIATYLRGEELDNIINLLKKGPINNKTLYETLRKKAITKQLNHCLITQYPWDLIEYNKELINSDFIYKNKPGINKANTKPYVSIYNEDNLFIDTNTLIEDFVVLDATQGAIYIEKNVTILAHTRIEGPAFIGKNSIILGGSFKNVSIGPYCKVAGEITETIIHGYTNKTHSGFIGNSYIGEWVNLGAGTTTSNLKNNYTSIDTIVDNKKTDTKLTIFGSIIGDYVKTSINTSLNTGTLIGLGSTLFNTGFHAKNIPPFQWGSPNNYTLHKFDQFIKTTKVMMLRRNNSLSKTKEQLLYWLFQNHS